MRIGCISDLHGQLDFNIEECDILLIAGDLCPANHDIEKSCYLQANWLSTHFRDWLSAQPVKRTFVIAGNHDWMWECAPNLAPSFPKKTLTYLQDSLSTYQNLNIYGTPWQPPFCDWAFNRSEERLKLCWEIIPEETHILLCHCPPYKKMDKVDHGNFQKHIGSPSLLRRIQKVRPKYVVFGHAHSNNGVETVDGITYINCCLLDEDYKMVYKPRYFDLDLETINA